MQFLTLFIFLFTGLILAGRRAASTYCYRDNCLRAVAGTHKPGHPILASNDCKSILAAPTTPLVAVPTYASACSGFVGYSSACSCLGITGGNFTVPATITSANTTTAATVSTGSSTTSKSGNSTLTLSSVTSSSKSTSSTSPPFISATVTSTAKPSSSSYPLTNSTVPTSTKSSISPPFTNSTATSTTQSSTSISFPLTNSTTSSSLPSITSSSGSSGTKTSSTRYLAPTCTNTLTDPMNCGTCGNVCGSGTCENGACTSSQCAAQKCGGFTNCNDNTNCFCFSSTHGTNGFCGSNAVCSKLTACANDEQCNVAGSTGNICAVQTCCPQQSNDKSGVCLQGQCGNPSAKLMMMAKARMLSGLTAAF